MYGKGRMYSNPADLPAGYDEGTTDKEPLGRPKKQLTKRNKQEDNFGKDRLGVKRMKDDKSVNEINAAKIFSKYEGMLNKIPKNKSKNKTVISEGKVKEQKS